jgi:23S rRNA (guanosine2251-2'-O)-methyltransferase
MQDIVLVVHNVRSTHNIGSIMRTCDGLGVKHLYLTGYTPYPEKMNDERLPHIRQRITRQIHKTALGAENSVKWTQKENLEEVTDELKNKGYLIASLEQTENSVTLNEFELKKSIALIVGNEVDGLDKKSLALSDVHLEIPMKGKKESFNVAIAAGIAIYHLSFFK